MSSIVNLILVAVALFMAVTFYLVDASHNLIWLNLIIALFFAVSAYKAIRKERRESRIS